MKNQQIERKNSAEHLTKEAKKRRRETLAFIEAHGSKKMLRKVGLVIDILFSAATARSRA